METLDRLFSEARNEVPETTLSDVQKWIVPMTLGALILAYVAKMKLIVTLKPFIMISSAILTVGIGAGTIFMLNTSTAHKTDKPIAAKHITTRTKQNPKLNETVLAPVIGPSQTPVAEEEQQPVLKLLETWNNELADLPNLSYCQSLPVAPLVLPFKPYKSVSQPSKTADGGEIIEINDFTTLKIWGAVNVVLLQGEKATLRIEGESKDDEAIQIETKGQTLEVYSHCKENDCNTGITIYITAVSLKAIDCSGASSIKTEGELKLENLKIEVSGASDLQLKMNVTKLKLTASGASHVELTGTADNMEITNSGAADIVAEELIVQRADVDCSGASLAVVNVMKDLKVTASGASEVKFKGDPDHVSKHITGASGVKNIK